MADPIPGLHYIKNSFEIMQDPRFPATFQMAAGAIVFSDGVTVRVPHIDGTVLTPAAAGSGFVFPDGKFIKLTIDRSKVSTGNFTPNDPAGCVAIEIADDREDKGDDGRQVFYIAKKYPAYVDQLVLGDVFVKVTPFQFRVQVRTNEGAPQWRCIGENLDNGGDDTIAGWIRARSSGRNYVTKKDWTAFDDPDYGVYEICIKIPINIPAGVSGDGEWGMIGREIVAAPSGYAGQYYAEDATHLWYYYPLASVSANGDGTATLIQLSDGHEVVDKTPFIEYGMQYDALGTFIGGISGATVVTDVSVSGDPPTATVTKKLCGLAMVGGQICWRMEAIPPPP